MKKDIVALRDFSREFDCPVVVTFAIHRDGQAFQITTYGETKKLCKLAGHFGDEIMNAINDGRIEPPDTEPLGDPSGSDKWVKENADA